MLAIKKSEKSTPCIANVLPCRIQHNGRVNASSRHWNPETNKEGEEKSNAAYFRGRKLCGRTIDLPEGYTGTILQKTDQTLPSQPQPQAQPQLQHQLPEDLSSQDLPQDPTPETKVLQEVASFDKLVVWGHEMKPEDTEDVYVKAVDEWIDLATAMNSWDEE